MFLNFSFFYVQSQHGLVGLGVLDTLKEERKERSKSWQGHLAKGVLKKRNWLKQSLSLHLLLLDVKSVKRRKEEKVKK